MHEESSSRRYGVWLVIAIVVGTLLYVGISSRRGGSFASFQGKKLPSIESDGTWLNSEAPLSWASLNGNVVWLEFSFIH